MTNCKAKRSVPRSLLTVLPMVFLATVLASPLSGGSLILVPWQVEVPTTLPSGQPLPLQVSGPENTSFAVEVTLPNATVDYHSAFRLPANATSPQSFLAITVQIVDSVLGNYTVSVTTGTALVANATIRVVSPYNITTIYENLTELQQAFLGQSLTLQNVGGQLALAQSTIQNLSYLLIIVTVLFLGTETLRMGIPKVRRRLHLRIRQAMVTKGYNRHDPTIEDETTSTTDPNRVWHTTCCPVGRATYYSILGARFHYKRKHGVENPSLGSQIILATDAVERLRLQGKVPNGIPADYEFRGTHQVDLSGVENL
jgi:hypothetical protein